MSTITLYRLTDALDDITTTDKIIFNDPSLPDFKKFKKAAAYCTKIKRFPQKGTGDNQGVGQDLADLQPVGNVEDIFTITGHIEKRTAVNGVANPFLTKLREWDSQPTSTIDWPEGRFGLKDDGEPNKDVVPIGIGNDRIGLIWQSISYDSDFSKDREMIEISLRVSRGSDE